MEAARSQGNLDVRLRAIEPLWRLWEDGTVAGLRQRLIKHLRHKYRLPDDFAEDVVGEAFDHAVRQITEGKVIRNYGAWFYKVVGRCAAKRIDEQRALRQLRDNPGRVFQAAPPTEDELANLERTRETLRERALAHAAELAPCVGTGQVRDVFDLFLEAARNEIVDGVPEAIAETLDIPVRQATTLIHRALNRLSAEAKRRGVLLTEEVDPNCLTPSESQQGED